jgi:hypothetical protein
MADKTDTAEQQVRLYAVLVRLVREYQGLRYVLKRTGPTNWAKLLSDYRQEPSNQRGAAQQLGALSEAIEHDLSTTDFVQIAAQCLEDIVPIYPSETDQTSLS